MADPWLSTFPGIARPFLEETDHILQVPLSRTIEEGPNERLNATEYAQPAIMAVSLLIVKVLAEEFGFRVKDRVDVTLGHSLGEYTALVTAGYLDYGFALKMVRGRAEKMAECTRKAREESGGARYGMVALICEEGHLEGLKRTIQEFLGQSEGTRDDSSNQAPAIDQVLIANENSKNQIVLSGSLERIRTLLVQIREFGGHDPRAVELKSESPFHSPIMEPAEKWMRKVLEEGSVTFPGLLPCISNVSGRPFRSKEDLKDLLSRQCVQTVRWWESLKYLDQKRKSKRWIGIGPGKVGRNLVGKEVGRVHAKGGGVWSITDPKDIEPTLRELEDSGEEPDAT